jgi:hypothetical protein
MKSIQSAGRAASKSPENEPPLSREWKKEIARRVKDLDDPLRYMLVSEFGRKFILYYNVTSDSFAMNDPTLGTLFKRRQAAEGVKKLLGRGVAVVKFTAKGGKLKRLSPFVGIVRQWRRNRAFESGGAKERRAVQRRRHAALRGQDLRRSGVTRIRNNS